MGEPVERIAEDREPVDGLGCLVEQTVGERPGIGRLGGEPPFAQLGHGGAEAGGGGDLLDPGPPVPFLGAAEQEGREAQTPPDQQGADPPRAAELVGGDRAEVGAQGGEVDGDVAGGGAGVDVGQRAPFPGAGHHLGGGLDGAHLVVGQLHRHQHRLGPDPGQDGGRVVAAQAVDAGQRRRPRPVRRLQHGGVLHGGRDDVDVTVQLAFLTAAGAR